jgi:arylsulfatase A-like enzyme
MTGARLPGRAAALAAWLALSACTLSSVRDTPRVPEPRPPNVVILLADDQRYDTVRSLGCPEIRTPALDRLAREGFAFSNAYILGAHHGAVCMPSRAMLLTGRPYYRLPESVTRTWAVPAEERGRCPDPTFPELLRDAGYETFATGKWHNGPALLARGFTGGANLFFGGMSDHLAVPVHDFDPSGAYAREAARRGEKFSSELFADAAIEFLETRDRDRPFLLHVAFTAPHDPRMAPTPYAALYPPESLPVPRSFLPEHPFPIGDLRVRDELLAPHPRTPETVREHLAAYYAMITHLDDQIARILDAVERTGEADRTFVVFTSDNGLAVGRHGLLGKQNLYECSIRVPLVVRGPGVPAGGRSDAFVYVHDLFPTVCEWAGVLAPDAVESASLGPLLAGDRSGGRTEIFFTYSTDPGNVVDGVPRPRGTLRAVRVGRWKLIRSDFEGERRVLLFDLETDPRETDDLSGRPEHRERVEAMSRRLDEWEAAAGLPESAG